MSDIQYQTVKEAVERLGVMPRTVQKWASLGKLPGAVRHGNSWMIPVDAERPRDGRYKGDDAVTESDTVHKIVVPVQSPMMITSPFYNKPGTANSCVKSLSATPETQALFAGQVAFWQGDVPKALELIMPLLDVDADFYGSLNIGMTLMTIAVWENDNDMWAKGRERLSCAPCKNDGDKKIRDIWLAVTDTAIPQERRISATHRGRISAICPMTPFPCICSTMPSICTVSELTLPVRKPTCPIYRKEVYYGCFRT